MGLPGIVNLNCYRGDTWAQTFRLIQDSQPVDLAGSTVAAWARQATLVEHLIVTVGPAAGEVTVSFPNGGLAAGPWNYDLEVTDTAATVKTWVRGCLRVAADVTNADA